VSWHESCMILYHPIQHAGGGTLTETSLTSFEAVRTAAMMPWSKPGCEWRACRLHSSMVSSPLVIHAHQSYADTFTF